MSKVNETSSKTYIEDVTNGLVLVDVYGIWCSPCKMISPLLDKLATERTDIKVLKLDVDSNAELCQQLKIRGVPTLLLYQNGVLVSTRTGGCTFSQLVQFVTIQ